MSTSVGGPQCTNQSFIFTEQLWKKSTDGKLLNKLRCWLNSYCRTNFTSLPESDTEDYIQFGKKVLTIGSGTNVVTFQAGILDPDSHSPNSDRFDSHQFDDFFWGGGGG